MPLDFFRISPWNDANLEKNILREEPMGALCVHLPCSSLWLTVEVEVRLWPTVNRPVCLGVRFPSGAHDQIFVFCLTMWISWCGASSLMRGWVCKLLVQLLLGLASAVTFRVQVPQNHILLSHFETSPPIWRSRFLYLYPPGTGWPICTPGHWVPFLSPLTTCKAIVEVF
jgi:hypothetical protein